MQARLLSSEQPFPSTSSIATASFVESLLDGNIDPQVLEEWLSATRDVMKSTAIGAANEIPYLAQKAKSVRSGEREWTSWCDGDLYFLFRLRSSSIREEL